jgi:hypothetical protein
MTVQLTKKEGTNILRYGDPVSMTLHVSTKPSTVDFMANPSPVCVNASPVVLTNNSTSGTYYYTWTATKGTLETTAANITTRDNSLALVGTELCGNTSFDVTLKAASDAAGTCYKEVTKTISVKNETPAITCPTTAKTDVTLLATESAATYILQKPTITGMDCTTDPTVTVTFSGTALDGTDLSTLNFVKKVSELPATVSIPATAGASGTTGGNNGVTIKYSVTNYCGTKTVDCSYTVIVRDVSAPNIQCSGITNYNNVKLSNYTGCQAIPGGGTDPTKLPALTAPVLEDQDHPGTKITGTFVQSVTNGVKSTVLPTAIDTGETVITWKFTDLAGNSTTCTQTIDVYDDKVPTVTCPAITDLGEITIDHALCYVTHDNLIKQIKDALGTNLPTATDACHGNLVLKDTLVCKQVGAPEWLPVAKGTNLFKGHYDLEWRFYKQGGTYTDKTVFAKCDETFVVVDKQAADLNCNVNKTWTVVSVNTTTDAQGKEVAQTYASAAQPTDSTTSTLYTLAGLFHRPEIIADNCDKDVEALSITIKKADGKLMETYSESNYDATMNKLKAYPFKLSESGYTVTYTYTDNSGNAASCVQNVIVLDREKPIPNCWADSVKLFANNNCQASSTKYSFESLSMGSVSYIPYKGTTQIAKVNYDIYPYKIVRNYYGNSATVQKTEECDNDGVKKTVDEVTDANGVVIKKRILQTSNYKSTPTACLNTTFGIGKTEILLYYNNGFLKDDGSIAHRDADEVVCHAVVIVTDTTRPSVTCGKYAASKTIAIDDAATTCEVPAATVNLPTPTLTGLSADDNCTGGNQLKLSLKREKDGSTSCVADNNFNTCLDVAYPLGTTKVTWIVTDSAGNASTCVNTITVEDKTAPDCPPLADVLKDVSCVPISGTAVGLTVPTTTNDKCSPVGTTASIAGVGSRADGKDVMNGAYKVGTTLVNWTFTDAAGNKRVCPQNVVVKDTARPEFDCDKLKDIEMTLAADQCVMPKSAVNLPVAVAHDCGDETDINGVATNVPENYPVGLTTIKWTFTDKSGNIKTCDQKVTINDNTPPTVTCPSDVTVDAPKNECSASVSLSPLTINDKCDGNITAVFAGRSDTKARDDNYPVGTTTVTWTFTDKSTNVTTCKQNITVKDITPPELVCGTVNSFTIPTNLNSCSVEANVVGGKITVPTAHDACDNADITLSAVRRYYRGLKGTDAPVLVTKVDGVTPAEWNTGDINYKPGYTDIYFIFKDAAGNADSCKKTVFVNDINAPSIICGTSSYTLHPDTGQCSVTIDPAVYYPGQATDLCQNTKLDGTLVNLDDPSKTVPASITISSGTTVKFGWIYTTAAGQTTTCSKSITVTDDQKPVFDCANWAKKEITVTAVPGNCEATGAAVKTAIGDYPKAADNCGGTASITGVPVRSDAPKTLDDDFPVGNTTITWTFTDNAGNYVTCDQLVTVKSGIKPFINCDTLKDIFDTIPACDVTAEKLVVKTPVGRDSCAHKSVTPTFVRNDGATVTDSYPLGNTTITWTFTGISNPDLSVSCSQTVNVRTSQKMVLNCPSDTTKVTAAAKQCVAQVTLNQLYAEHPCLKDAGGNAVKIAGVAYNAATKQKLDNLTPNLNAGITKIMWIFTDNSNTLADNVDTCYQIVDVLSPDKMEMNCPSAPTVESSGDQCSQEVTLTKPTVTVPCLTTPIKVEAYVGSTKLGDDLKYTFPTGDTKVKWVFTDTTHTLLNAVDSCFQTVRVLSTNKLRHQMSDRMDQAGFCRWQV